MTRGYIAVDVSNVPDLKRLAEAVRESGRPHALTDGTETIAVVRPAPKRKRPSRSVRRAPRQAPDSVLPVDDPAFAQRLEDVIRAKREAPIDRDALFPPLTPEVLAKRQAVYERILAHLPNRVISPLTAADLIHEARAQEEESYGFGH
ncbi:MAG: hypothetical protein ACYDCQ_13830 [Dehalococcoidia bacterium]